MKLKLISGILLLLVVLAASCQSDEQVEFSRYYAGGSAIYQSHCQNCHGAKGEGLQALVPPLNDIIYLTKNKTLLSCFIKNGLKNKITINGRSFEGEMPAADLAPIEIAKVLTYVTNSFGNKVSTINLQQVENDLKECK